MTPSLPAPIQLPKPSPLGSETIQTPGLPMEETSKVDETHDSMNRGGGPAWKAVEGTVQNFFSDTISTMKKSRPKAHKTTTNSPHG